MSAAPNAIIPTPPTVPIPGADDLERRAASDRLEVGLYRAQERARRMRGVHNPTQAAAIEQMVDRMGDHDLLLRYSDAWQAMDRGRSAPSIGDQQRQDIEAKIEERRARMPVSAVGADILSGMAYIAQDIGLSAIDVAGALAGIANLGPPTEKGHSASEELHAIAEQYRERVLSGRSDELGTFLQEMNVQASQDGWGVWFGKLAAQALPSAGAALRGVNGAKRAMAAVMGVYTTYAAGQGIAKYRREKIDAGESPQAWEAMLVGLGYGAAEIATENIDRVVPWQHLSTSAASAIGEAILRRNPKGAARYIVNAAGMATTEGLEEVLSGELQEFVDRTLVDGKYDRTWSDRLGDFGGGAAGAGLISAVGVTSRTMRESMMQEPTPITQAGIDRMLNERAREWLASEGRETAIAAGVRRAIGGLPAAPVTDQARIGDTSGTVDAAAALREYRQAQLDAGAPGTAEALEPEDLPASSRSMIDRWAKRGVTVIPVRRDESNPLPAYATGQRGVVVVELSGSSRIDEQTADVAMIAHEALHTLRDADPEAYGVFVDRAVGPLLAASRGYLDTARGAGLDAEAAAILADPDRLVEEGGATLFQTTVERAGLVSLLADTGSARKLADFARRAASRWGLRGPAAEATVAAFESIGKTNSFAPKLIPDDIRDGARPRRFAVRKPKVSSQDPAASLRMLSGNVAATFSKLDVDLRDLQNDTATFAAQSLRNGNAVAAEIMGAKTAGGVRVALRKGLAATTGAIAESVAQQAQARIEAIGVAANARRSAFDALRKSAAAQVRRSAPKAAQGKLMDRVLRAKGPKALTRAIDAMRDLAAKAEHAEAMSKAIAQIDKTSGSELDPAAKSALDAALARHGLSLDAIKLSPKRRAALASAQNAMRTNPSMILPKRVTRLFKALASTDIGQLSTGQLRLLRADIKAVRDQASTKRKLVLERRRKALEQDAHAAAAEMSVVGLGRTPESQAREGDGTMLGTVAHAAKNLFTLGHMKPQTAAELIFGSGSVGERALYHEPNRAAKRRLAQVQSDTDYLEDALTSAGVAPGSDALAMSSAVLSASAGRSMRRLGRTLSPVIHEVRLPGGGTARFTSAERITMLGLMANGQSHDLMLAGTPLRIRSTGETVSLDAESMRAISDSALPWERAVARAIFDRYNGSMAAGLRGWFVDRRGSDQTVENYWPLRREVVGKPSVADWTDENLRRTGLLQERTRDSSKPIVVDDAYADYLNHSWRVAGVVNIEPAVSNARQLLASASVADSARETGRTDALRYFDDLMNQLVGEAMGHPSLEGQSSASRLVRGLRNNVIRSVLALNPKSILYQTLGLAMAATQVEASYLSAAVARGAMFDFSLNREIVENSPSLRQRINSSGIGFVSENDTGKQELLGHGKGSIFGMRLLTEMDAMTVRAVWKATRMKLDRTMPNATERERIEATAAIVEHAIEETQPTFELMQMSAVSREAREHPTVGLLTMFMSQTIANLNVLLRSGMRATRGTASDKARFGRDAALVIGGNAIGAAAIGAAIEQLIKAAGGSDDDKSFARRSIEQLAQNTLGMFLFGNIAADAAGNIGSGNRLSGRGGSSMLDSVVGMFNGVSASAENVRDPSSREFLLGVEKAVTNAATLAGVPVSPYRIGRRFLGPQPKRKESGSKGARRHIRSEQ